MVTKIRARLRCRHPGCGGNVMDLGHGPQCLLCSRPHANYRDYGRIGGLQTILSHGRDYMAEIGRRGGLARRLPAIADLRQQSAPKTENKVREGMAAQPNNLRVLKELYAAKIKRGELVNLEW